MALLSITVTGVEATVERLQRLGGNLVKLSPANETIGKSLAEYYGGVAFQSKGRLFGEPWAPLQPATEEQKVKDGYRGAPDLVRTQEMRNSFNYTFDDQGVTVGNTDPKFPFHQSDADRSSNLPRRVMIGINDSVNNLISDVINDYIGQIVKEF